MTTIFNPSIFSGHVTAIMIVTHAESHGHIRPNSHEIPYEFYLEGFCLNSYTAPKNVKAYIYDKREIKVAREYCERTFEIGSIWRVSGQIEYDDCIVFVDPVYMPYNGEEADALRDWFDRNTKNE